MFITLKAIFKTLECSAASRTIKEGEELIRSKHIVLLGATNKSDSVVEVMASCLKSSALQQEPHKISGAVTFNNTVVAMKCSCKAGNGGRCKHIAATLLTLCSRLILTNTVLMWDSSAQLPLKYNVSLMSSEGLQRTDHLNSAGYILVVMDIPPFIDQLTYIISGALIFDKNKTVNLPNVKITTEDVADNQVLVPTFKVIEGEIESFSSFVIANEKFEFLMVLPPNWSRALESILEIDCCLSRIALQTPTLAKSYYISQNLNEATLLEVERTENMILYLNIYCRNEDGLASFLHFLHSRLPGVLIVPHRFYLNQYKLHEPSDSSVGQFKNCIQREFGYLLKSVTNMMNPTVRRKLADLENSTDTVFGKMKFENKNTSFDLS